MYFVLFHFIVMYSWPFVFCWFILLVFCVIYDDMLLPWTLLVLGDTFCTQEVFMCTVCTIFNVDCIMYSVQ